MHLRFKKIIINYNNGVVGELSYVCVLPNTSAANVLLQSGAAAAGRGAGGSNVGGVTAAGSAGTVWAANSVFSTLGEITAIAGQAGGTGGGNSVGANVTAALMLTGGAGGAGYSSGAGAACSPRWCPRISR